MTKVLFSVVSFLSVLVLLFGAGLTGYAYWKGLSPWLYGVSVLCLLCFLFGLMDMILLKKKINMKEKAKNAKIIEQEAEKLANQIRNDSVTGPELSNTDLHPSIQQEIDNAPSEINTTFDVLGSQNSDASPESSDFDHDPAEESHGIFDRFFK